MNQKDLIKWGVVALGAYLIWKYVQDHGGIEGLLGTSVVAAPGTHPIVTAPGPAASGVTPSTNPPATQPANTIQPVPVLDLTGLTVMADVNDSLTGVVKINGVPVRLSIITSDGRIFDNSGSDVSASLQSRGIDVAALRTAFQNAIPLGIATGTTPGPCQQPNFFNASGVCVDPFSGQPIPNTMTQAQQNAGVSGLGTWKPYWLM